MKFDFAGLRPTILIGLWQAILSKEQNRFCSCHSPFFVHTNLKQFIHAASIGKCQHCQSTAEKDSPIQTFKIYEEFLTTFCLLAEPVVAGIEQCSRSTNTSVAESDFSCVFPAGLPVRWLR